jgi:hypothetical protein
MQFRLLPKQFEKIIEKLKTLHRAKGTGIVAICDFGCALSVLKWKLIACCVNKTNEIADLKSDINLILRLNLNLFGASHGVEWGEC